MFVSSPPTRKLVFSRHDKNAGAVQKVQALPLEMQEQAARMLLAYAGDEEPVLKLTPEEGDLIEARAEMRRGEFATAAEVEAVFAKYRR
jgi:hypothetical protein